MIRFVEKLVIVDFGQAPFLLRCLVLRVDRILYFLFSNWVLPIYNSILSDRFQVLKVYARENDVKLYWPLSP